MAEKQKKRPWWETQGWWNVQPRLDDPTTWPIAAPITAAIQGRHGGPNWMPIVHPVLKGPLDANEAVGQGIAGALGNTIAGMIQNPANDKAAAPAAAGPQVTGLTLAPTPTTTQPLAFSAPAAAPAAVADPFVQLSAALRQGVAALGDSVTVTSSHRTEADNTRVDGVANSWHKRGTPENPLAYDLIPKKGQTMKDLEAQARAQFPGFDVINEGDHIHVEPSTQQAQSLNMRMATPMVAPGQPGVAPPVAYMDPNAVAGLLQGARPQAVPGIDLPDAPVLPMPEARPELAQIDKAIMDQLAAVIMPKERDASKDPWDRVSTMLASAAQAAAGMGPGATLGQVIGAAGGAGGMGFRAEREEQEDEILQNQEMMRQAQVALAKMGIDIDLKNLDTRNMNLDRNWQSGEDRRGVTVQNLLNTDARGVQEQTMNHNILSGNIGANNNFNSMFAQNMVRAYEAPIAATNRASEMQATLNNARSADPAAAQETEINTALTGIGVDTGNSKNPVLPTARGTYLALKANDGNGAVNSLAAELTTTEPQIGLELLGDPKDQQAYKRALEENPAAASSILAAALRATAIEDQKTLHTLIRQLADRGNASAKLIAMRLPQEQKAANGKAGK